MKKFYFLAALVAGIALTSCTSEDDLALSPPEVNVEDSYAPIVFSSVKNNVTRADITGKDAADSLGNKFVVTGFKGSETKTPGSIVFDNYLVEYAENTAETTESNTNNWEYVGKELIPHAVTNGITKQTIKYWDYSQTQYDFIAWSTGKKTAIYTGTPGTDEVLVTNIQPNSVTKAWTTADGNIPARVAYTFTGTAADLSQCYIADLVTVKKGTAGDYGEVSGYGNPVTLKFRQLGTKVRIGLYETIPGYSVKDVKFYTASNVRLANEEEGTDDEKAAAALQNNTATLFTTTDNEIYTEGTYYVYFPTVDTSADADNNQAHIYFAPKTVTPEGGEPQNVTQARTVAWGGLDYTIRESGESSADEIYLGRTSNTASFAGSADENYYHVFLPNQNGTNLNLRVNYTLESIDGSKEEIFVKGATAQVPLIYAQWKPGYAYTYLFKISDKTNGYTGVYDPTKPDDTSVNSDPAGLFPITFDAVVVNAEEDATQETITLVATPSITTYQNGSNVVNNNEYTVINSTDPKITGEIYVTVNDADAASYSEVTDVTFEAGVTPVGSYYVKEGEGINAKYVACAPGEKAADGTTYYKKIVPALPNGTLATLTDKVALYAVADGTTEAQVIDALQMQDDDTPTGVTIKGRNKVELTEASGDNALELTNEVTYGADGNKITVETNQAAKFIPAASTTYAFVYTKTDATTSGTKPVYEPVSFSNANVTTKYRFAYNNATVGDAQKGVVYFTKNDQDVYTKKTAFIGQGAGNLYTSDGSNYTKATTDYVVTSGAPYYYTVDDGANYTEAHKVAYENFNATGDDQLYVKSGAYFVAKTETEPVDGIAYYYRTGTEGNYVYTYCVILPEQVDATWYELDTTTYAVADESAAVEGQTYFDKYEKNDAERYVKVIKVQ